ncbi:hypothetical protein EV426DRAFT_675570 [Tirmania nivea]|nr:hypothetical protein EV426DRAFT_675570 [Tirmania nivea]
MATSTVSFHSPALEELLWFESQCLGQLEHTWKMHDASSQSNSTTGNIAPRIEAEELTALLGYIQEVQKGNLKLTWDSFSPLVQPFFETWSIPVEPKYLGPINSLTKDVLAHLGRTDEPQYAFIRHLALVPTEEGRELETVSYFKETIKRCSNLVRVDIGSAQLPSQVHYRDIIRAFNEKRSIRRTLVELALDLNFDTDDKSDILHPANFLAEFRRNLNGYIPRPVILKIGRWTPDGSQTSPVTGNKLGLLAPMIPKEVIDINFNFLIRDVGDAIKHFIPMAESRARLDKVITFGITSPGTATATPEDTASAIHALLGFRTVTPDDCSVWFRLCAPFGQLDDKFLLAFPQIEEREPQGIQPETFCKMAGDAFQEFFGGVLIGVLGQPACAPLLDYHELTQTLSKIPPNFRVVVCSSAERNWKIPDAGERFSEELARREELEFRLSDEPDPVTGRYHAIRPLRQQGPFEEFLKAILPRLHSLKQLVIAFDKLYMHRSRHSFNHIAPVLDATLPELCQKYNLCRLTLNLGPRAGYPGPKTQEWISGQLPVAELEGWAEPHIQHCGFLLKLHGLTALEINHLEIITPGQYDWLLRVLPILLPKTLKRLSIGHVRLFITSAGEAARPPNKLMLQNTSAPALLQLGRDGSGLGTVTSYLEWQGELVARARREIFTRAKAQGVSELNFSDVHLREVTFWGLNRDQDVGGRLFPPFCRQRKSGIRRTYGHVHRGSPL